MIIFSVTTVTNLVKFQYGEVTHEFQGREYTFEFRFRDPWEWILDLVTDSTLVEQIMWYPVRKYLHDGHRISRVYDELNSGDTWWKVQVFFRKICFIIYIEFIFRIHYLTKKACHIAFFRYICGLIKAMWLKL
jgi:hypothetical protein